MNQLVVIGNGFDRKHNMNTTYEDFKKYLQIVKATDFKDAIEKYIQSDELWRNFESALGELDYRQLEYDNSSYLKSFFNENWKDSAYHDYQYMIKDELSFHEKIQHFLKKWILSVKIGKKPVFNDNVINKKCIFLNFNYTNTLEKLYNIPESNILYIHGKAIRGDNLVVGHHDDAPFQNKNIRVSTINNDYDKYENDFRLKEGECIINEYFSNTYKDTDYIINKNLDFFFKLSNINIIYILGHSLSDIDFEYFKKIKESVRNDCKWNITYYSNDDLKRCDTFVKNLKINYYDIINYDQRILR